MAQYANKLELDASHFCAVSGPTKHSSYVKGNCGSNVASECSLRKLVDTAVNSRATSLDKDSVTHNVMSDLLPYHG